MQLHEQLRVETEKKARAEAVLNYLLNQEAMRPVQPMPTPPPQPTPAAPTVNVVDRPPVLDQLPSGGWKKILGWLIAAIVFAFLVALALWAFDKKCDISGWFSAPHVAAATTPPATPAPVAPAGTCDATCLLTKLKVVCHDSTLEFEGPIREMKGDDLVHLLQAYVDSDKCPAAKIVPPADITPPADNMIIPIPQPEPQKICLCEPAPKKVTQPRKKVVIQKSRPAVETACYLRVRVEGGRTVNVHIGIDGVDGSHFGGDKSDPVQGTRLVPVPCKMVYAQANLEVCFERTGESELLDLGLLANMRARYEAARAAGKSQVVLNVSTVYWYPS